MNTAPCVAYAELTELPSRVVWKLVSSLRKAEGESFAQWCGSEDSAQAGKHLPERHVGFSQCGGLPFEIREREQIFDLEIKNIFRKKNLLSCRGNYFHSR